MNFRYSSLAAAAALLASCDLVAAADLPARRAPPVFVPPPIFSWTGFYLGGYAGAHFNTTTLTSPGVVVGLNKTGFTAGGLVGYNYQISNFVVGIEGEVGYSDFTKSVPFIGANGDPDIASASGDVVGRIRGRVGLASGSFGFGNALFYVAGGASFLEDKTTLTDLAIASTTQITRDRVGYNIGGGVEVAVTNNWIVRAEYIFDDYGTRTYPFLVASGGAFFDRRVKITDNTVRAAIEYKFDVAPPAPVVAKY